ncbi:MAG: hypothetical protein WAM14_07905 [Candidatus Nitrosopolaris sp.]
MIQTNSCSYSSVSHCNCRTNGMMMGTGAQSAEAFLLGFGDQNATTGDPHPADEPMANHHLQRRSTWPFMSNSIFQTTSRF